MLFAPDGETVPNAVVESSVEVAPAGPGRSQPPATTAREPRARSRKHEAMAAVALVGIAASFMLRWGFGAPRATYDLPLQLALVLTGIPIVWELAGRVWKREFGSDLLAGISIVASAILGQWLAGTVIALMLTGGNALETLAARRASAVLHALARRMPNVAHRVEESGIRDIKLDEIRVGDLLVMFPHEICPVDGVVLEGHGVMDESYLTGEPYQMSKTPGTPVLSGAINGEKALRFRSTRLPVDSRYARIMRVMEDAQQNRPPLRRLGDRLGAYYTPIALAVALGAWIFSGESIRFLAVLVIATPCPLLLAIPISILAAISLAARRGIVIRDPAVLELADSCRTMIFDKTGTLTYGMPKLTEQIVTPKFSARDVLAAVASLEQYSKHPLAQAVVAAARDARVTIREASEISEPPGEGLRGVVNGTRVWITSRARMAREAGLDASAMPKQRTGLECQIAIDGSYAATYRFRDEPRAESKSFVAHLSPRHAVQKVLLVSGDRESETRALAERVGVSRVYAGKSPEEKVAIVREETARTKTIFVGDGINDAPALLTATVGIGLGRNSEVVTEAAGAVILDPSLSKVDEFLHIGRHMRRIALQSAVGGMALSIVGMGIAAAGFLPPVAGALAQEVIDFLAAVNALRAGRVPKFLTDF